MTKPELDPEMQRVFEDVERVRLEVLHQTGVMPSHREVALKLLESLKQRQETLN